MFKSLFNFVKENVGVLLLGLFAAGVFLALFNLEEILKFFNLI